MNRIVFFFIFLISISVFTQSREANDCVNFIAVCGNQAIKLNPYGPGQNYEIGPNVCNSEEHNSLWLKFTVETDGTLGFDLIPESTDIEVDYDFWVFGPNVVCGNLGSSIRCSTTNPYASGATNNHTGMRSSEPANDFFEGPGANGDNYVKSLDVKAGESYFLVIDRPIGSSQFTLNWTGTATLQDPFSTKSFNTPDVIQLCDFQDFDFSTLTSEILNGNSDFKVAYFNTYEDANYFEKEIVTPIPVSTGKYYFRVYKDDSECFMVNEISIVQAEVPNIDVSKFNGVYCDDDFDGSADVNFTEVKQQIVNNFQNLIVRFFLNPDYSDYSELKSNTWTFSSPTTVYVKVENGESCVPVFDELNFSIGGRIFLNSVSEQNICDSDLNDSEAVELSDYISLFTNDNSVHVTYYTSLANARNKNQGIDSSVSIGADTVYYLRFENATNCPEIGILSLKFYQPLASQILEDIPICEDDTTTLSVEENTFDGILWSTGSTDNSITVGVGDYYVDLTSGYCTYRQYVRAYVEDYPTIAIETDGSTATIVASGGIPEYQYAVDNQDFGSNNIFENLSRGKHTAYLIDAMGCTIVSEDFYIINIQNAITPNGDGINDILDYSDLQYKEDVILLIFDRYGKMVFKGSVDNQYIWDGTHNTRDLPSGSYWYVIQWKDPGTNTIKKFADWILLKNRK